MGMDIEVKVIPHSCQRYPTVGDWIFDRAFTKLTIYVSQMGDWRYHYLAALHEQVEAMQCYNDGVSEEAVSLFDIQYEKNRPENDFSEPGNDPNAPYHLQHKLATSIEMQVAQALGINWEEYDAAVNAL
jgi:hypothetical protein